MSINTSSGTTLDLSKKYKSLRVKHILLLATWDIQNIYKTYMRLHFIKPRRCWHGAKVKTSGYFYWCLRRIYQFISWRQGHYYEVQYKKITWQTASSTGMHVHRNSFISTRIGCNLKIRVSHSTEQVWDWAYWEKYFFVQTLVSFLDFSILHAI